MFARLERFANSETVENIVLLRFFRDHKFFIGPGCLVYREFQIAPWSPSSTEVPKSRHVDVSRIRVASVILVS